MPGILFIPKTGIPYEDLQQEMGCSCGMTCGRRLRDRQQAGPWDTIHRALRDGSFVWTRSTSSAVLRTAPRRQVGRPPNRFRWHVLDPQQRRAVTRHVRTLRQKADGVRPFPAVPLLDYQFASHLMGVAKPASETYSAFDARTGYHGKEILFFDDLAENVEAARQAGWWAERIDHDGDAANQVRGYLMA